MAKTSEARAQEPRRDADLFPPEVHWAERSTSWRVFVLFSLSDSLFFSLYHGLFSSWCLLSALTAVRWVLLSYFISNIIIKQHMDINTAFLVSVSVLSFVCLCAAEDDIRYSCCNTLLSLDFHVKICYDWFYFHLHMLYFHNSDWYFALKLLSVSL